MKYQPMMSCAKVDPQQARELTPPSPSKDSRSRILSSGDSPDTILPNDDCDERTMVEMSSGKRRAEQRETASSAGGEEDSANTKLPSGETNSKRNSNKSFSIQRILSEGSCDGFEIVANNKGGLVLDTERKGKKRRWSGSSDSQGKRSVSPSSGGIGHYHANDQPHHHHEDFNNVTAGLNGGMFGSGKQLSSAPFWTAAGASAAGSALQNSLLFGLYGAAAAAAAATPQSSPAGVGLSGLLHPFQQHGSLLAAAAAAGRQQHGGCGPAGAMPPASSPISAAAGAQHGGFWPWYHMSALLNSSSSGGNHLAQGEH